ncbi:hypothetical protein G7Z17_g12163 [Cylindrodendrum hubeiense]|uniref:NACHT domain-containing protein n=1 Tax=Cylindrodendrum hubeiense TaxID=595255 RepID=A0A9P5GZK9_9HYPO|nr:hypothetical protein G7Z17_g12163 [Cylindrodendrum hubeiense]
MAKNGTGREASAIFATVSEEFKKSLQGEVWKKISDYQDADAMLKGAADLLRKHSAQPSKLRASIAAVDRIASRWRPYFNVVDVFVQSNPEYAALAWGSLRVMFQMASNFTTLFQKIENMLLRMAYNLPDFSNFLQVLGGRSSQQVTIAFPRLAKALAYIYQDMLEFCHRVCKLLTGSGNGKPGFGKTTLATLIIDHLKNHVATSPHSGIKHVFYYFFDRRDQMSQSNKVTDAIRALLSQVIFFRRHDPIVLDIASLVRPWHDTGQQVASDDEVFAMLQLNLLHAPNCIMICDGVDECADPTTFLQKLDSLAVENKRSRFILLGRPILKLHSSLSERCQLLGLEPTQNLNDLKQFIEPKIEELVGTGDLILPGNTSIVDVVSKISGQASGMFLWTRLFMKYLESPSFSLSARWRIIEDPTEFGGLHNIFHAIFEKIQKDYQGPARINIRRALQWVLGASRPLHINELRNAIGQEPDREFDETNAIPNFEEALGVMTGALLEITEHRTVRLIHHTVGDFLVSEFSDPAATSVDRSIWDFRPLVTQHYISSVCLAFLRFTMPEGPYRKPFAHASIFPRVRRKFPLIDFVTRYWIAHLVKFSEELRCSPHQEDYHEIAQEIGENCISLIRNTERFTSWAESMWYTQCEETVWPSEDEMIANMRLNSDESALGKAFSLIRWAYVEHNRIPNAWRDELEKHPEKIWLPSLPALSNTKLVGTASDASISPIIDRWKLGYSSIVILTRMSATGHAIGIVSIKPPGGKDCVSKEDPTVLATYQIHSLDFNDVLFETTFEVRLDATRYVSEEGSFSIDASISEGLLEIVVEDILIKLSIHGNTSGFAFQQTSKTELDILKHHRSFYCRSHLSRKIFLGYGAELLFIMQQVQGSSHWIFDVFQDSNCMHDPSNPNYWNVYMELL